MAPARPQTANPALRILPVDMPAVPRPSALSLKRQGTMGGMGRGKIYTVAYDGSRLAARALRLAAWFATTEARDKIRLVTVCKDAGEVPDKMKLLEEAEQTLLTTCGLRRMQLLPKQVVRLGEGESITGQLAKAAAGGHLVMGATGKRVEDEAKSARPMSAPSGRASSGKATPQSNQLSKGAMECMEACRAPVILVKQKATPLIDQRDGIQARYEGRASQVIVVPVDGGLPSQKCFDMALRFAKKGDEVRALHVVNTDKHVLRPTAEPHQMLGDSAVKTYYEAACAKAAHERGGGVSFSFEELRCPRGGSVSDAIVIKVEELLADIVICGSVELARASQDHLHLGSVSANVAKRTSAHVLIAKEFA